MANKVDDGRLVRMQDAARLHEAWTLKDDIFVGAGIRGTGYSAYFYCHTEGATHIEVEMWNRRTPMNFENELAFYPWDEKSAKGCIQLVHDVLEILLPTKLLTLESILDGIYAELQHRGENGLEPLTKEQS